jgi:far upstream element-binding protein
MIIGKGGETIKDIQSTTGCKINVSPQSGPGEVEREIGLVGSRDAIAAAKRAIEEKVEAAVSVLTFPLLRYTNTLQAQKSGGGGRSRAPQNDYGDRAYSQPAYSQQSQAPAQAAPAAGAEDPYAACEMCLDIFSDQLLTVYRWWLSKLCGSLVSSRRSTTTTGRSNTSRFF